VGASWTAAQPGCVRLATGSHPLALELAAEGWVELENARAEGPDAAATFGLLGYLLESIGHRRPALDMFRRALRIGP